MDDLTERECGDDDRMGNSAVVVDTDGVEGDSGLAVASLASIDLDDPSSSVYRDLDALRATAGEKDGRGFTGVPSPGDVMDTDCALRA